MKILMWLVGFTITNIAMGLFVGFITIVFGYIIQMDDIDLFIRMWIGISLMFGIPLGILIGSMYVSDCGSSK